MAFTGFMGCGKSSVGRALAWLVHWHFLDLDTEIERSEERKISDIFGNQGEQHFRRLEAEMLRSVLRRAAPPLVLALGGGTFVQANNAELLRSHGVTTVFLDAPLELLIQRCTAEAVKEAAVRPLAADLDQFARLYHERVPSYRSADLTVESDNRPPIEVARRVGQKLGLLR